MSILKLENASKSFEKNVILKDINLEIDKGEMVSIIGESGSGKTTLLNIIGLILEKDCGNINIFGYKNVDINSKEVMLLRRHKIGYLFQNYGLIDDETVFWNLNLALEYKKLNKKSKDKKINDLLNQFNLIKLKNKKIFQLSGGEQQRIAILRLILQESELILADEPTGSLDKRNEDLIVSLLEELNRLGKTIIIVTHNKEVANRCSKIIEIKNNTIFIK